MVFWEFFRYGRKFTDWIKCYLIQFSLFLLSLRCFRFWIVGGDIEWDEVRFCFEGIQGSGVDYGIG